MLKAIIKPDFLHDTYLRIGKLKGDNIKYLCEASWDCSWYWGFGVMSGMDYKHNDIDGWTHVDTTIIDACWKELPKLTMFEDHVFQTETEVYQFIELMKQFYTLRSMSEVIYQKGAYITTVKSVQEYYRSPALVEAGRNINRVVIPAVIQQVYNLLSPSGVEHTVKLPSYWGDWATPDEYLANEYKRSKGDRPRVLTAAELERLKEAGA